MKILVESVVEVRLVSGRCYAEMEKGASGLRIKTPSGEVLDLGTRFGVEVLPPQQTSVHVFEGKVELDLPQKRSVLSEGEAAQWTRVSGVAAISIEAERFVSRLPDNGASPNDRVRRGKFGAPGTTWNLGVAWAHASNTPMKFYKRTQHSGGVTTLFIVRWPNRIKPEAKFNDQPLHITDVLPTLMELVGARYPIDFGGKKHPPLPGRSFARVLTDGETLPPIPLYFSLFNNMAIVDGGWRMVTAYDQPWQLYDLTNDRTETRDVTDSNPKRLQEMLALQKAYSERPDVKLRLKPGEREPEYASIYKADGKIGPGARESVPDEKASLKRVKQRAAGMQPKESEAFE